MKLPKFVPPLPQRILSDDIDYLQKKGAFLLPEPSLRNELLRNYVQYVQPFLPLIELTEFLEAIHKNDGSSTVSLLLFQAVMFAATAYIDMRYLAAQGYESRKAARKAFFQRIKLLYDFDYETDRVTVVQAVLIMTYWYESPDDPKDVWHWLGVAISLARTIGLNVNTTSSPLSPQKQKLWKRIWWSCYMRDRLISIGMRRPIRIREDDYDVPILEVSDFETEALPADLARMVGGSSAIRDPSKRELLARMCIQMIKICQCITHVLEVQYSMLGHRLGATSETTMRLVPKRSAAERIAVMQCDRELETWYNNLPEDLRYFASRNPREKNVRNDGEVLNLHRALISGVYLTASSALHRPQMMPAMPNLAIDPELKELSKDRVHDAASAITDIFRDFYSHDLIRYLPNTGVTILLPAIIVHLLDIKSPDSATRQLSVRRFHFCMQALQRLRDIYASADFAFLFLDAAVRRADVGMATGVQEGQATGNADAVHRPGHTHIMHGANLTPPPDAGLKFVAPVHKSERSATVSFPTMATNPQHLDTRRNSFAALSPPSSDRSGPSTDLHHRTRPGPFGFMAPSQDMFHHTNETGYVDASHFMDLDNQAEHTMIDEEAMQNDFDQLINLECHNTTGMDLFSYDTVSQEEPTDSTAWLARSSRKSGSVSLPPTLPKQEDSDVKLLVGGIIMPTHDLEEPSSLEHAVASPAGASVYNIEATKRKAADLRRGITGGEEDRKIDAITVTAAA